MFFSRQVGLVQGQKPEETYVPTTVGCDNTSTRIKYKNLAQLQAAMNAVVKGNELVAAKLDRLSRAQVEVVSRLHQLQKQGIHVRTLDGLVNTKGLGKFAPVLIGLLAGWAGVE